MTGGLIAIASWVVLAAVAYLYVRQRGRIGHTATIAILVAGWGILGTGPAAAWLEQVGRQLATWFSGFSSEWLGIGGPALLLIIPAIVAFDLSNRSIYRPTPWFALISPTLLVIVGAAYAGRGGILGAIGDFVSFVMTLPSQLGG